LEVQAPLSVPGCLDFGSLGAGGGGKCGYSTAIGGGVRTAR